MGEVDVMNEIGAVQDTFAADFSGNVSRSSTVGEDDMVHEDGTVQDTLEVTSSGNVSTSVKMWEMDGIDETGTTHDTLEGIFSGNVSTSAKLGEVNAVEDGGDQDTFQPDFSGNASSNATYGEARVEEETFENNMLGSISGQQNHMAVESVDEATDKEETYEQQYPALPSISMWSKAIDKTGVSLKPVLPLVRTQEQARSNPSVQVQEGSVVAFSEQNQPISVDQKNKPITTVSKQDLSISAFLEKNKSMAACDEQEQSIVDLPEQNQSIRGSHKQHKSVPDVPEQIQPITFRKQDQSIVSVPRQKQPIVVFRKQDLSIVGPHKQILSVIGTLGEGQTKQVPIIDRQDASLVNEVEVKDGNYIHKKTDGAALHVFDTENVLQKHQADRTEKALE